MSIPASRMASTATGLISSAGSLPADGTRSRAPARRSRKPAAIWLRPALWTQTKRTAGRSAGTLTPRSGGDVEDHAHRLVLDLDRMPPVAAGGQVVGVALGNGLDARDHGS